MTTAAERAAAQQAAADAAQKAAIAAFAAKRKPAATAGHPFAGNANKPKPAPLPMTFDQAIVQVRIGKTVIRTGCGLTPADVAASDWTVA